MRIRYTRIESTVYLKYWLDGMYLYEAIVETRDFEDELAWLQWAAQEGSVWFDNVEMSNEGPVSTEAGSWSSVKRMFR